MNDIDKKRRELGMTVKELACAIEVSPDTMRSWIDGKSEQSPDYMDRIARLGFDFPLSRDPSIPPSFTFADLFAGIGGIRIPFQELGGECVFSSEWDPHAQRTYFMNFGDVPVGDIRNVDSKDIPDFDVLLAGFPCQPFSIAGVSKKRSMGRPTGFEDKTQGTLFFEVARIIRDKRPRAFLLENVKNLISHDKGNTFKTIVMTLERELGYKIRYRVLDASQWSCQHRERIYIVGFRDGTDFTFEDLDVPEIRTRMLSDILQSDVDDRYTLSNRLWETLQRHAEKHRERGNGFGYGLTPLDSTTRTLSARYHKDGSEILVPQGGRNPRRLTPRECARLQGFPDSFIIPVTDTQAYREFGNSVSIPVVRSVAKRMVEFL